MTQKSAIRTTYSVCPVCFRRIKAELAAKKDGIYMEKTCPEHGDFSTVVWRGKSGILSWYGDSEPIPDGGLPSCPSACISGICPEHKNETCCVVLEVTNRCSLNCKYCFADGGGDGEPKLSEIESAIKGFVRPGYTLVQLSGGEPTMREDIDEVVRAAKTAGCKYVQLNTNGIKLAEDETLAAKLASAGLSFVFLQFDGMDDEIYVKLRGRPLADIKRRAIENCAKHNIGVTLVPTVVRGVNEKSLGEIIRFAVKMSPAVRGVHFQPVAHIGRIPHLPANEERITLDELMAEIESQSMWLVKSGSLQPSRCDHPMCGFHGDFIVLEDGTLYPLTKKREDAPKCCCGAKSPADSNREFVGRRWQRSESTMCSCQTSSKDITDMEYFLERLKSSGFTITSMAFQDAGNLDIERLSRCSLHAAKDGKLVPFCANYLTSWEQR